MAKVYDVVAVIGQTKDGKAVFKNFGAVFETQKGLRMKLDSVPIGTSPTDGGGVWFGLYEPREDGQRSQRPAPQQRQAAPESDGFADEIPF